jgi:hypothetical protein
MCFNPGKSLVVLVYVISVRESVNVVKSENSSARTHTQVWNWNCLIGKARKKQSMNLSKLEKNKNPNKMIPWKSLYKFC